MNRFPDKSKIVFLGDSITAGDMYTMHVMGEYRKQFPESGITFFNAGVSGGTVASALHFFERDVLALKPTHATVMYGINDCGFGLLFQPRSSERYTHLKEIFATYQKDLICLVDRLQSQGINVVLLTPPPYAEYQQTADAVAPGGYALIQMYAEFVRTLAREKQCECIDIHTMMTEAMQKEDLYNPDHVHPTPFGQKVLAELFLRAQGITADAAVMPDIDFPELHSLVFRLRRVMGAEWMIVHCRTENIDEQIEFVQKYLDEKRWAPREIMAEFATHFVTDKRNEGYLRAEIKRLTE